MEQRPSPEDYQPRLAPWGHAWRLLLMLGMSAVVWLPVAEAQWTDHPGLFWVDVTLGLGCYGLVHWRRYRPLVIAVVITVASSVSGLAGGPAVLAGVSLATGRRLWQVLVIGVLSLVAAQTFMVLPPPPPGADPYWLTLTVNSTVITATLLFGMYIGSRRELIWTLRQRALRAEAEQELRVDRARAQERGRIAREMHDVLAHRISQVSMHAGALAFRDDLDAQALRGGVGEIQEKANRALHELRSVLGVLRDGGGESREAPQPTYADLSRLVAEARRADLHVELVDEVARADDVPEVVGRTAYRIVQEGITNVRKHAPGSALTVHVSGDPTSGLDVVLRNPVGFGPGDTPGAGLGLVGLTERAELRGGRLEHRTTDGVFELHAWIPWAA